MPNKNEITMVAVFMYLNFRSFRNLDSVPNTLSMVSILLRKNFWYPYLCNEFEKEKIEKDRDDYHHGWCKGAPGIILSRLGCNSMLNSLDSKQFLNNIYINSLINKNDISILHPSDIICCGNFGKIDALLSLGLNLKDPSIIEMANNIVKETLNRVKKNHGWFQVQIPFQEGITQYGFFDGLSGIGYELIRLYNIEKIPSILSWE